MSYTNKGVDLSKYEKYGKKKEVELSSERVDLGAVQDLEKSLDNLKKLENPVAQNIDRLTNLSVMIRDEKKESENNLKSLNSLYEKSVSQVEKLEKMSKELGVEVPILKTAKSILSGVADDYKDLNFLLRKI